MAIGAGQVQGTYILLVPDLYVSGGEHQELLQRLVIAPHGRVVERGQAVSGNNSHHLEIKRCRCRDNLDVQF